MTSRKMALAAATVGLATLAGCHLPWQPTPVNTGGIKITHTPQPNVITTSPSGPVITTPPQQQQQPPQQVVPTLVPTTPPPKYFQGGEKTPSPECSDEQDIYVQRGGRLKFDTAEDNAATLQAKVADMNAGNPDQPNPSPTQTPDIADAANALTDSSAAAKSDPLPSCADPHGYFIIAMEDYHIAAQYAQSENYAASAQAIIQGADATAWLRGPDEAVSVGFLVGPATPWGGGMP
jgi:hypothetical protein